MNERRAEKDDEQEISKNQDLARSQKKKNKDLRSSPQYFTWNYNKIIKDIYALKQRLNSFVIVAQWLKSTELSLSIGA